MPEAGEVNPNKHKAFVISPIGEPGSELRRHADWVLNEIILKACGRAGGSRIVVERSDHSSLPGPITSQVINSIVNDAIIFAVLAGDRPNVYYELAVALAAARPVILLRHDQETTHFDVKDFRAITYTYDAGNLAPEAKIAEVANFVASVLKEDAYHAKAFGDFDALARLYREYQFFERFRDIDMPSYSAMFTAANSFIGLQGISLRHFTQHQFLWNTPDGKEVSFFDLISGKILFDAVSVNIVMLHPDNPVLPYLFKFADRAGYSKALANARADMRSSIEEWNELKKELDARSPERADGRKGSLRVTALMHGTANYRLTLTDRLAVVSPDFNIFPFNSAGPALVCSKATVMYDRINKEFFDRIVSEERAAAALKEHGSLEIGPAPNTGEPKRI
jgi:hypothetical protein